MIASRRRVSLALVAVLLPWGGRAVSGQEPVDPAPVDPLTQTQIDRIHLETPVPRGPTSAVSRPPAVSTTTVWERDGYLSVQVNVDAQGNNILGDAGNEPSIAIGPNAASTMVIGWRQFDTVSSDFRQSGMAYSHDGGSTWTNPGVLEPGVFSSDPVLDFDADGRIYYYALQPNRGPGNWACYMYGTDDGGLTWPLEVYAYGGDKAWLAIDRTGGIGRGNIYVIWSSNTQAGCCGTSTFSRSTNRGLNWMTPQPLPVVMFSHTMAVGPNGEFYVFGSNFSAPPFQLIRSTNANDATRIPSFDLISDVDLGGVRASGGINPAGLLGQAWVAVDNSTGPNRGNVYALSTVARWNGDPADVMFARSTDGGVTWSDPIRLNDDPAGNYAWQWFGTMSVAPNGRIDVIFNDTRHDPTAAFSELYYTNSVDGGETWSTNIPVSQPFNHSLGWPMQAKLGDYYDMISDRGGANVAYAATFNGEQDVYYLRIGNLDCNGNGLPDDEDIADGRSTDCDSDLIPDECERDCDGDGEPDPCEVASGAPDCDGNWVPDSCQQDFDGDGLIDACDADIDNDGVPNGTDLCDFTPLGLPVVSGGYIRGDFNIDCLLDRYDFAVLVDCVVQGGPEFPANRVCAMSFDYSGDAYVDLRDVAEFDRLVGRIAADGGPVGMSP